MATYQELFEKSLDWDLPFDRKSQFPLDRSSLFPSYADALAYAKQDKTDSRGLGGTSYVGQIIAVFGPDAGTVQSDGSIKYTDEVAAYIIKAVGENAALMKLAQASATGDLATDVGNLQTALGSLESRIKTVEDATKNLKDTDTTYEITTGVTTDGSIHVVTYLSDGTKTEGDVQVKGWDTLLGIAGGRTQAYVYQDKNDANYIKHIAEKDKYKVGDLIYFKATNIPDEWVSEILDSAVNSSYYKFSILETQHPDLSGYLDANQIRNEFASKQDLSGKADASVVSQLSQQVSQNAQDISSKASQQDLNSLQEQLNNIDVSNQIGTALNALSSSAGGSGYYIESVTQHDGKVTAVAQAMPNVANIATTKANEAKQAAVQEATGYTDTKVGDIGENQSVKGYVDSITLNISQQVGNNTARFTQVESNITTNTNNIAKNTEAISQHTAKITTLETAVTTLNGKVTTIEQKLARIEDTAQENVIEKVKLGGTALSVDPTDKSVNIESISTDLLTQGDKRLILDCSGASLAITK